MVQEVRRHSADRYGRCLMSQGQEIAASTQGEIACEHVAEKKRVSYSTCTRQNKQTIICDNACEDSKQKSMGFNGAV